MSASQAAGLRVLFLHPKTLVDSWPFPVDTLGEVMKAPSAVYPILAGVIADLPVDIEIFDGYVTRETLRNYRRRLARADVLAISIMSPLKALDTEVTIRLAKAINPAVTIVVGGNHATAFPERWIECGADFVVVGEGEIAFRQLMEALLGKGDVASVPNLVYRRGDGAVRTAATAPSIALDDCPMPRWELMDLRRYSLGTVSRGRCAAVELSRGCPHRCDFCNINTFWGYRQRYKSVERIIEEMDRLQRLGVRELIFTDDNFGHDYDHTTRLLETMIRRNYRFGFGSFLRGDTVRLHSEFAALAARAGMRFCMMGIETLDPRWLKSHRKGVRAADAAAMYADVYRTLHAHEIFLVGLFITPAEAPAEVFSGKGVDGVVCDFHYSADLVAQKGSALYDTLAKTGSVGKDMFYHDWNMPSIVLNDNQIQPSRRTMNVALRDTINTFAFRAHFSASRFERRLRWRHLGIIAERLLCSSATDVRRFRIAKDRSRPLDDRQQSIVGSMINDTVLNRLRMGRRWKSPLAIRNGLWSTHKIRASITGPRAVPGRTIVSHERTA
jgi:anaerobic magnesium-protoporphyrin IX monomethyl ester cyclase